MLEIFNITGQQVRKLLSQPHLPGIYEAFWNGTDDQDMKMSSVFRKHKQP